MCGVKKYNCKWLFSFSGIYTHGHLFEDCFSWLFSRIYVTGQFKGNDITKFPDNCHWSYTFFGNKLLSKEKNVLNVPSTFIFFPWHTKVIKYFSSYCCTFCVNGSQFLLFGASPFLCCRGIREKNKAFVEYIQYVQELRCWLSGQSTYCVCLRTWVHIFRTYRRLEVVARACNPHILRWDGKQIQEDLWGPEGLSKRCAAADHVGSCFKQGGRWGLTS